MNLSLSNLLIAFIFEMEVFTDWTLSRLCQTTLMLFSSPCLYQTEPEDENQSYHSLASIMQSLKGFTAYKCNRLLGREGEFWAHESFDHFIRDHEEWKRIIKYVLNNPVKAGYVSKWQEWRWSYRRNAN